MLSDVFEKLCGVLKGYTNERVHSRVGSDGGLTLFIPGPLMVMGRKMPELFFVGATPRKASVVFYYMPVYMNEPLAAKLDPELMKLLKGKTCFHLKKWTPEIEAAVRDAMENGREVFETWLAPA